MVLDIVGLTPRLLRHMPAVAALADRGFQARLPDGPEYGPVLLCSEPGLRQDEFAATEVKELLLRLADIPVPTDTAARGAAGKGDADRV